MNLPIHATMYSDPNSLDAHRLRLLAAERNPELQFLPLDQLPDEIQRNAPENVTTWLVDKSIIVFGEYSLEAYLLERYPGEHLLATEPVTRAKIRMICDQLRSWYNTPAENLGARLREFAAVLRPGNKWFAGHNFSLVDIAAAPLLWRASKTIDPSPIPTLLQYKEALFSRANFRLSPPPSFGL